MTITNAQTYHCEMTGSHTRQVQLAPKSASSAGDAIQYALGAMLDIYEQDKLHEDEARRAFAFWTPDEIKSDLDACGQCDIVLCGGYYCITIKRVD